MRSRLLHPALLATALLFVAMPWPIQATPVPQPVPPAYPCTSQATCPDLIPDPATMSPYIQTLTFSASSCEVQEGMTPAGTQRLVRYDSSVPNKGPGDLVIGRPGPSNPYMYYSPCHRHYHVSEYTTFRVWSNLGWTIYQQLHTLYPGSLSQDLIDRVPEDFQPAVQNKAGWCVIDIVRYPEYGGSPTPHFPSCGNMGVTAGWADYYGSWIPGQWVVVTGLAPGNYMLEVELNAGRTYGEVTYDNNRAAVPIVL